ncbi:CAP domain-containing protein [Streptomyces sp. NBC_00096]|uniref:CAP domain-containing protein n=1 Tax=Streptomyces sp. NBC_00096 TaxID=2975650 RepID=UPI003252A509
MGRHKTPPVKGTAHVLPTGARLVASVAVAAAGAGALAAALVPAGGVTGLHEVMPRIAHAAAARPAPAAQPATDDGEPSSHAAQPSQAKPAAHPAPASEAARQSPSARQQSAAGAKTPPPAAATTNGRAQGSAPEAQAAAIKRADALQRKLDSTSPDVVLSLVNQAREQAGSAPLRLDSTLGDLAGRTVADLPDEPGTPGIVTGAPAPQPGVAAGTTVSISRNEVGAQAAVNDWLKDPVQRAKLLDPALDRMGIASTTRSQVIWWAQVLGK